MPARIRAVRAQAPDLGQGEDARQDADGPVRLIGGRPQLVVQGHHVAALDVGRAAVAEPRYDMNLQRATADLARAGFTASGDILLEATLDHVPHGRRLHSVASARRRVLASARGGDDLGGPRTGVRRGDRAVRPDGGFHDLALVAILDDVTFFPVGCTRTPKPLMSSSQTTRSRSRGTRASTVRLVIFGMAHVLLAARIRYSIGTQKAIFEAHQWRRENHYIIDLSYYIVLLRVYGTDIPQMFERSGSRRGRV